MSGESLGEDDPTFGNFNRLQRLTDHDDERALVLSIAAFAEEFLAKLLSTFMCDVTATRELLDGFNAPLGTLSARIKACYALGLVSKTQYRDLEYIRKIRNEFAHNWEGCSFSTGKPRGWIEAMSDSRIDWARPDEGPPTKFRLSAFCVLTELHVLETQIKAKKTQPLRPIALHLSTKPS